MANNKTGKDASGATFTYKTTDNAGVDTPHVNVDNPSIYVEGDVDTTINGAAILWEDAGDTLRAVSAAKPLPIEMIAGTFAITSGADPLTVGNDTDVLEPTITVSTSAYAANDVVGGRIQLSSALGTLRSGIYQNNFVFFKGNFTPRLDLYLFNAQPTQNTADNGAFAWNSADDAKLIGIHSIVSADYKTIPGATTRTFAKGLPGYLAVKSVGSADLWLYIVTLDAVTLSTTSDLRVGLGFARD